MGSSAKPRMELNAYALSSDYSIGNVKLEAESHYPGRDNDGDQVSVSP